MVTQSKPEGLMGVAMVKPRPKEEMPHVCVGGQSKSKFSFIFTLFVPSLDQMMPSHVGGGHLPP